VSRGGRRGAEREGSGCERGGRGRAGETARARRGAAANKWGMTDAGARWQRLGAGVNASGRVGAALISGAGSTVGPIRFSN
jgi:hypothetical protein